MKRYLTLSVLPPLLVAIFVAGCCHSRNRTEPELPDQVSGWVPRQDRWLRVRGEFVLRKGQATENEDIAIQLVEVEPPSECAEEGSFQSGARARLQFRRVRDRTLICEQEVREKQTGNLPINCRDELASFELTGFEVSAINIRNQWIVLRLLS